MCFFDDKVLIAVPLKNPVGLVSKHTKFKTADISFTMS